MRGDSVERASLCSDAVSTYVAEAYKARPSGRTPRNPVQTMIYKSRGTRAVLHWVRTAALCRRWRSRLCVPWRMMAYECRSGVKR